MYISVYTAALSICLTNLTVPPACRINDQLLRKFSGRTGLVQALCVLANGQVVGGIKTKSYGSPAMSLSLLTNVILMFIHAGGEKSTGGGRESGSDAWKQYMRRSTW